MWYNLLMNKEDVKQVVLELLKDQDIRDAIEDILYTHDHPGSQGFYKWYDKSDKKWERFV